MEAKKNNNSLAREAKKKYVYIYPPEYRQQKNRAYYERNREAILLKAREATIERQALKPKKYKSRKVEIIESADLDESANL